MTWQGKIYLVWLVALMLCVTGCQGSDLGNWMEQAIAPDIATIVATPAPMQTPLVPPNFPANLPQPTNGKLIAVHADNVLSWQMDRSPEAVLTEYAQLLQAQNWQIGQRSPQFVTAQTKDLWVIASVHSIEQKSQLLISYFPYKQDKPTPATPVPSYVQDLQKITALDMAPDLDLAEPIKRREYARWLVRTNNYLFQNRPSRQVRLAPVKELPTFADVPPTDPDFPEIQGLANGGFVARNPLFRPEDPLTREEMVQMKIPFDLGQLPPPIEPKQLEERWRFQDTKQISAYAQRAIAADALLGDSSNIRRSFGFTSLLQPQRPVSRKEALASLWYFGTPTDGISARSSKG
jgi:hypothetical protein